MKYFLVPFFFGLIALFSACRQPSSRPPVLIRQQYTLTGAGSCDSNRGVDMSVAYFLLPENTDAARRINDSLRRLAVGDLQEWLDRTTIAAHPNVRTDLATMAALIAAEYQDTMKGMDGCWAIKVEADTLYTSPRTLTVSVNRYTYAGGVHPNSNLGLYVFDRETGRALSLTDLVSDTTALLNVVERTFRRQQELLPSTNLKEAGFFLRDGRFFLPTSIGMSRTGMVFYYNQYEIASYAYGPIEVTVPYDQLGGILRTD